MKAATKRYYRIIDCQQAGFFEGQVFSSKEKIREALINLHRIDCNEAFLKKMTLNNLLEFGEWQIERIR